MKLENVCFVWLACSFLLPIGASAQNSIRTEVFSLSTCDPTHYSLIKDLGNETSSRRFVRKLETRTKNPTAFQITGINPLRYKYYINNEAVTQFMESSPLTFSLNSFSNGEYLLTAPEIKIPEIFKTDSISSKVKIDMQEFQKQSKILEDSIEKYDALINEIWENTNAKEADSAKANKQFVNNPQLIQLQNRLNKFRSAYDRNLREYDIYTRGLPINNPKFAILEHYRLDYQINSSVDEIDKIKQFQHAFAEQYRDHHDNFQTIDSLLNALYTQNYYYYSPYRDTTFERLKAKLKYYNFALPAYRRYGAAITGDNGYEIRKQILNKRFQIYQEFVLNLATKIGVLVQNLFRDYSSYNNTLESLSCIDDSTLGIIGNRKDQLIKTFEYIQKTSAELQIMVSYLDINTELYQNIAKKINTNYVFLLSYLKNLNFVAKEATKQYTLPTHTNLKNIDLVRYKVTREDKITKATQTYNYDFWVRGGLKIDFSVGIFASRLTDNKYSKVLLDTIGGIDSIRITRQDDGHTDFAFGGMVNVTPRNGASWINIGGSVGVAYSSSQKLQMLAGLAIHLGKTERLIIQCGMAFGTIKYLDIAANDFKFYNKLQEPVKREHIGGVKENDRIYILHSSDIMFSSYTIPTVEKFVGRPFIGISYNLSRKSALQAVSGGGVQKFTDAYNAPVTY